ncbi:DUF1711-domain-containing protein [Suhomyces tanzawaensis NRRL Y-17324]|uniref:DUF1711-domain-containing protein n=1 Tax=Suhomyces tanzawaensis NRRL Y-17324 TaxID=984487 RepID=A0A1E4SMQ6_9ASCO|nr:DUF1711-domain-containing protein [Suhomyces tanzawaensis NRRL Y-17324]ODV80814.1 DUF1711-domain-containing protein [Suhomyces tanzawaensis NRRL Y-17324]
MGTPKRYWATVQVPTAFLKTLPEFAPPVTKSKAKKPSDASATSSTSTTPKSKAKGKVTKTDSSPTPETVGAISNFKINSGLKESSTSGLTMNSITSAYTLDKSGAPCKKWVKKPHQFKTFSGFKVKYIGYGHAEEGHPEPEANKVKEEPAKSVSLTPDIRSEA